MLLSIEITVKGKFFCVLNKEINWESCPPETGFWFNCDYYSHYFKPDIGYCSDGVIYICCLDDCDSDQEAEDTKQHLINDGFVDHYKDN